MELKSTKTHSERAAILSRLLFWMLQKWKTEQIQECLKMGPDWKGYRGADYDKNFIFTQNNGSQMHICSPAGEYNRIIRLYNQYIAKHLQNSFQMYHRMDYVFCSCIYI